MPLCFIEGPSTVSPDTSKRLIAEVTAAIHAAYPIPDTRVSIRPNPPALTGQDGEVGAPFRASCFLEVPPGLADGARRTLVKALSVAIDGAFHTEDTLVFFREYPLSLVSLGGTLQSENQQVAMAMKAMAGAR